MSRTLVLTVISMLLGAMLTLLLIAAFGSVLGRLGEADTWNAVANLDRHVVLLLLGRLPQRTGNRLSIWTRFGKFQALAAPRRAIYVFSPCKRHPS